ncbi:hypothetical protein ACOSQ4_029535 [Xanthoceras sorbifolium]
MRTCCVGNKQPHRSTRCYGYDNSKKESVAARDKSGEPPPQERFQADEGGAAEEVHTDTGEVPRSLTVTNVEGHTDEAEIFQVLGKGLVGETSGSSRDFVVDENANSYLVKEESQTLGADRGLVEVAVHESSLIFSQSGELSSIQSSDKSKEEPEVCSLKVKK